MRLLQYNNGDLSLTTFFADKIPQKYAILSHTWGSEEISFEDLQKRNYKEKAGYKKIRFCGEQARRDGLQYFWVDTCCIDKSSSAELTEAINSMFRWYRESTKCYVYLSDVSGPAVDGDDLAWEAAFRISRWFTRGWTLQELIAPTSVEFFSEEGERLGDKSTLEGHICEIARLPAKALQGCPLSDFSVTSRMSWVERRETTREEDQAYSLLGIFDVFMPLIYGEGKEHALERLREIIDKHSKGLDSDVLHHLPHAIEAPFNSYATQNSATCLPNTRVDLLEEIYSWVDSEDERCIFWLNGLAGTGKSTIARTVARRYFEQKRLGASFFYSRGGGDVGNAGKFFTSIAVQLAYNAPSLRRYISEVAKEQTGIANRSLRDQWRQLILHPLSRLDKRLSPSSYLLVIDALDECDNGDHIRIILELLAEARSLTAVRLRVFLTSRPEVPIRHGIRAIPQVGRQDFVLHNIQPMIVNHDISRFLEYHLGIIGQEWTLGPRWPGEEILRQLVVHASGLFIWAATACRFINEGEEFAEDRLDEILKGTGSEGTPEQHLDQIYITVLQSSIPTTFKSPEKVRLHARQRTILGSIAILFSPLPAAPLAKVISISGTQVTQTLERLQAILDVPKDVTGLLRLHHPSFRDFLLNKDRCGDFWVDEKEAHQNIATSCIQLMSQTLKKDICEMHAPGSQASQVESSLIEKYLPPEVQYACLYWIQHLQRSGPQLHDSGETHSFLQAHLLHWLEALGWMGKMSEGVRAILSLEAHVLADESPNLHTFIYDAKRFALYNRSAIEQAPLQVYYSALVFAPGNSIIRRNFKGYIPDWIQLKPKVQAHWNPTLQTLEGHSEHVQIVVFSHDSTRLASASDDGAICIWDIGSGECLVKLEGYKGAIQAIAFLYDSTRLVSVLEHCTIQTWDTGSGVCLRTLEGHRQNYMYFFAAAFSRNSTWLALEVTDSIVWILDTISGARLQKLEGHSERVQVVVFSHDSTRLALASKDGTIFIWDTSNGNNLVTFKGHDSATVLAYDFKSMAFSHDSTRLASASLGSIIHIWNAYNGECLAILKGHDVTFRSVAFSHDSARLVSGSSDNMVWIWDTNSGKCLSKLEGHCDPVSSVTFSHDSKYLASASYDKTVRIWDANSSKYLATLEGHQPIWSVIFSHDSTWLASAGVEGVVRIWDTGSGKCLATLEGDGSSATSIVFSHDSTRLAVASHDHIIWTWDTNSGECLTKLKGHKEAIWHVAFSHDSTQLASASEDCTIRTWDAGSGKCLAKFEGHKGGVRQVIFSHDSTRLASTSEDYNIRIWDAGNGACLRTLEDYGGNSIAFSYDSTRLASGCDDGRVWIWDTSNGVCLQMLNLGRRLNHISFDTTSSNLHTDIGTVALDTVSTSSIPSLSIVPQTPQFQGTGLSPDGKWITWKSKNVVGLPFEYRPRCSIVSGRTIGIGDNSGRVWMCTLNIDDPVTGPSRMVST